MSVLLTHGYFLNEDQKEQNIMRPYPPLGLLCISSFLNEHGVDNEIFDSTFSSFDALMEKLRVNRPNILAVYTNLMTKVNVIKLINAARKELPQIHIILGGPDVTYNTKDYLNNGADFIVIGEGENTMLELCQTLNNGESNYSKIDGIAYIDELGKEIKTNPRTMIRDINELPIPNREGINISLYLQAWKSFHGVSALNVSTQRGCPYTCKWCSTAVYGQSYRRRSPKNVVEELKTIKRDYNPDGIWFVDDVFTVSHKWLKEFVEELESQSVSIAFECISRADRMNKEVIALLKKAGCFRVWIGAESGSQRIIDAMDRRVSVEQVRQMIIETRRAGIEAGTFIMLGYPGETEDDINETIEHLKISNPDHFTITVAYPIKGTSLYNEVEANLTNDINWNKSTDRDLDFTRTYPRKYYNYAVAKVTNEVHYHKHTSKGVMNFKVLKLKTRSLLASLGMKVTKNFA